MSRRKLDAFKYHFRHVTYTNTFSHQMLAAEQRTDTKFIFLCKPYASWLLTQKVCVQRRHPVGSSSRKNTHEMMRVLINPISLSIQPSCSLRLHNVSSHGSASGLTLTVWVIEKLEQYMNVVFYNRGSFSPEGISVKQDPTHPGSEGPGLDQSLWEPCEDRKWQQRPTEFNR
ncbi:uncharacterized protein V6R79_010068 [Siganus canaliculatus]